MGRRHDRSPSAGRDSSMRTRSTSPSSSTSVRVRTAPRPAGREARVPRAVLRDARSHREIPSNEIGAALGRQLGRDQFGTQVEGRLAIGPAPVKGQLSLARSDCKLDCAVSTALIENRNAVLDRPGVRRRRAREAAGGHRSSRTRREPRLQPEEKLGRLQRFGQLEVDDLASTLDPQPQGQGEGHLGPGVESLSRRQSGFVRGAAFAPGSA